MPLTIDPLSRNPRVAEKKSLYIFLKNLRGLRHYDTQSTQACGLRMPCFLGDPSQNDA